MKSLTNHFPLAKWEALKLSADYQHLSGQRYGDHIIKALAIGPFDEINRHIFLFHLRDGGNINDALNFYHGPFYDVFLILEHASTGLSIIDLHHFLTTASPAVAGSQPGG